MVCFFLSLLKRKLPQRCPKRGGGGGQGHFWTMSERKQLFFRITSLTDRLKQLISRLAGSYTWASNKAASHPQEDSARSHLLSLPNLTFVLTIGPRKQGLQETAIKDKTKFAKLQEINQSNPCLKPVGFCHGYFESLLMAKYV